MKIMYGQIFDRLFKPNEIVFVTTNTTIKPNHHLVMGRGAALELKRIIPRFPYLAGKIIQEVIKDGYYGAFIVTPYSAGIFQVKNHYYEKADLKFIEHSTLCLSDIARSIPDYTCNINFPGIGLGGLQEKDVLPIINTLPDNVHVWKRMK